MAAILFAAHGSFVSAQQPAAVVSQLTLEAAETQLIQQTEGQAVTTTVVITAVSARAGSFTLDLRSIAVGGSGSLNLVPDRFVTEFIAAGEMVMLQSQLTAVAAGAAPELIIQLIASGSELGSHNGQQLENPVRVMIWQPPDILTSVTLTLSDRILRQRRPFFAVQTTLTIAGTTSGNGEIRLFPAFVFSTATGSVQFAPPSISLTVSDGSGAFTASLRVLIIPGGTVDSDVGFTVMGIQLGTLVPDRTTITVLAAIPSAPVTSISVTLNPPSLVQTSPDQALITTLTVQVTASGPGEYRLLPSFRPMSEAVVVFDPMELLLSVGDDDSPATAKTRVLVFLIQPEVDAVLEFFVAGDDLGSLESPVASLTVDAFELPPIRSVGLSVADRLLVQPQVFATVETTITISVTAADMGVFEFELLSEFISGSGSARFSSSRIFVPVSGAQQPGVTTVRLIITPMPETTATVRIRLVGNLPAGVSVAPITVTVQTAPYPPPPDRIAISVSQPVHYVVSGTDAAAVRVSVQLLYPDTQVAIRETLRLVATADHQSVMIFPPRIDLTFVSTNTIHSNFNIFLQNRRQTTVTWSIVNFREQVPVAPATVDVFLRPELLGLQLEVHPEVRQQQVDSPINFEVTVNALGTDDRPFDPANAVLAVISSENVSVASDRIHLDFTAGQATADIESRLSVQGFDGRLVFSILVDGEIFTSDLAKSVNILGVPILSTVVLVAEQATYYVLSATATVSIAVDVQLLYLGTSRPPTADLTVGYEASAASVNLGDSQTLNPAAVDGERLVFVGSLGSLIDAVEIVFTVPNLPAGVALSTPSVSIVLRPELLSLTVQTVDTTTQVSANAPLILPIAITAIGTDGRIFNPENVVLQLLPVDNVVVSVTTIDLTFSGTVLSILLSVQLSEQYSNGSISFRALHTATGIRSQLQRVFIEAVPLLTTVAVTAERNLYLVDLQNRRATVAVTIIPRYRGSASFDSVPLTLFSETGSPSVRLVPNPATLVVDSSGVQIVMLEAHLAAGELSAQFELAVSVPEDFGTGVAIATQPVTIREISRLIRLLLEVPTASSAAIVIDPDPGRPFDVPVRIDAFDQHDLAHTTGRLTVSIRGDPAEVSISSTQQQVMLGDEGSVTVPFELVLLARSASVTVQATGMNSSGSVSARLDFTLRSTLGQIDLNDDGSVAVDELILLVRWLALDSTGTDLSDMSANLNLNGLSVTAEAMSELTRLVSGGDGDLNGDGVFDQLDTRIIFRFLSGVPESALTDDFDHASLIRLRRLLFR